jgi:hypothetical protein
MKFKIDENLSVTCAELLVRRHGIDGLTQPTCGWRSLNDSRKLIHR